MRAPAPYPIRVGGPDLWYPMALVDTTVEQSLVSSGDHECVRCGGWVPERGQEVDEGMGEVGEREDGMGR